MTETELAEFVGLTCYLAKDMLGREAVPQGVIEKILDVATKPPHGTHIEGLGKIYRPRGTQSIHRTKKIAIEYSVTLNSLKSEYFERRREAHATVFSVTDTFLRELPALSRKSYFTDFEAWIRQLLAIWGTEGRLSNVSYLSLVMSPDRGTHPLVGDLEWMTRYVADYIWFNILSKGQKRQNPEDVQQKVLDAYTALREKLSLLQNAPESDQRIRKACKWVAGYRILHQARPFPAGSQLWSIFRWLGDTVLDIAKTILQWPEGKPGREDLFLENERSQVVTKLRQLVGRFINSTRSRPIMLKSTSPSAQLQELFDLAEKQIGLWCRVLTGKYDEKFFRLHEPKEHARLIGRNVVYYDIRKSTEVLTAVREEPLLEPEYGGWFENVVAIAKNWSIVFGGYVSTTREEAGDKVKAFFERYTNAVNSLALTLHHLDLLDSVRDRSKPFQFRMNAGIGESRVVVAGRQQHSTLISYLAHAINKLADIRVPGTSALALSEFVEDHADLKKYIIGEQVRFEEGDAHGLDYTSIAKDFCESLLGQTSNTG